jgi:hypothetical protein
MKPLTLILQTPQGETLGHLPLTSVAVSEAGESGNALRPRLGEEMQALKEQIQQSIAAEGMEISLDPIDFGIKLSEALLYAAETEAIQVPLPVRTITGETGEPAEHMGEPGEAASLLEGLFELNDLTEDDHV